MPNFAVPVAKSFRSFAVSDGLIAKVVEAIKTGDSSARQSGKVVSFDVFIHGQRSNMSIGQIMVVPAKVANDIQDFPTALLYGIVLKEVNPESIGKLLRHRIGESDMDSYTDQDMSEIKDAIFKDSEGKYRSLIVFKPMWSTSRDYTVFKFVKDDNLLALAVRHTIFSTYYDPALSSSFDNLITNLSTDKFDVTDITPKLNFPFLAEGAVKDYPFQHTASGKTKERVFMTSAKVAAEFVEAALDPAEKDVIEKLGEDLRGKKDKNTKSKDLVKDASGEGVRSQPDYGEPDSYTAEKNVENAKEASENLDLGEPDSYTAEKNIENAKEAGKTAGQLSWAITESNGQFVWNVFSKSLVPTRGPGKVLAEGSEPTREAAERSLAAKMQELEPKDLRPALVPGQGGSRLQNPKGNPFDVKASVDDWFDIGRGKTINTTKRAKVAAAPAPLKPTTRVERSKWALKNERKAVQADGCTLIESDSPRNEGERFYVATSAEGVKDYPQFDGSRVVWGKPDAFPLSFRMAVDQHFSKAHKEAARKKADVPLTTEDIWADIMEEMGPPPIVELKEKSPNKAPAAPKEETPAAAPAPKSNHPNDDANRHEEKDERPSDEEREANKGKSRMEKLNQNRTEPSEKKEAPKAEEPKDKSDDSSEGSPVKKEEPKSDEKKDKQAGSIKSNACEKDDHDNCKDPKGICQCSCHKGKKKESSCRVCKKALDMSKKIMMVSPDFAVHVGCAQKGKTAAFNMFIPGQVLTEFYPELNREIVDYPMEDGNGKGMTTEIDINPKGVGSSGGYAPSSPAGAAQSAMGLGAEGKPQVLEGAPLRTPENIRGPMFDEEFHNTYTELNPSAFRAAALLQRTARLAGADVDRKRFNDFLKAAVGEVAAAFIAAFRVTHRPVLTEVPGVGTIQLDYIERNDQTVAFNLADTGSRIRYLLSKLNDTDIKDAVNDAYAQAAVWNESADGGYTYEVYVRVNSVDVQTMEAKYEYVIGLKS